MRAAMIREFGPPNVIEIKEVARPTPGPDEICVEVAVAGVGPWDAFVRQGFSALPQPLPLTLGSDVAGVVSDVGSTTAGFEVGDKVFGVTNSQFTGGYAEYSNVSRAMIARKPSTLSFEEAASVPVVGVTALQMLFDYGRAEAGQHVLIHGAAGSVGSFAVQLARHAGMRISATSSGDDQEFVRALGADTVIDYRTDRFEEKLGDIDLVLDTVGGEVRQRSYGVLRSGGKLVSAAAPIPEDERIPDGVSAEFFLVEVTSDRLDHLSGLLDSGTLTAHVGSVLPLEAVVSAHEMLAGAQHPRGKIVLDVRK